MRRLVLAAALCAAASALPAKAHEGGVPTVPVLDRVTPEAKGVEIEASRSVAPVLSARNTSPEILTILGEGGEPFLRLGGGAVGLNTRSPTAYRAFDPFGRAPLPPQADAAAGPEWKSLGFSRSWRWFDPRLRAEGRWIVPMRLGDRPLSAHGHVERVGEHGHLSTALDRVRPQPPELEVKVLEGVVPALFVRNGTGRLLEVPGQEGEPFLRIGPEGASANTRSPTWYLAGSQGVRDVPPGADPKADPVWTPVSAQPIHAWLEYRARVPGPKTKPYALGQKRRTVLRWTTPATLGGEPLEIAGHVDWVPAKGMKPAPPARTPVVFPIVAGAAVVLVGLLVLLIRRRPGGGSTPPAPAP